MGLHAKPKAFIKIACAEILVYLDGNLGELEKEDVIPYYRH